VDQTAELKSWLPGEPRLERSLVLNFIGDWGQANFHRICGWLCQEFCDRAGVKSRIATWNTVEGGIDAALAVHDGQVDLAILTPAASLSAALRGDGIFSGNPMPDLRAIAVLPQNDKLVLAIDPSFEIKTFAELREKKPPLKIASSVDDGFNLIGYIARRYMEAHGIDEATLNSWGGGYINSVRPEQSLFRMRDSKVDAVLQEAIMTPWWREAVERRKAVILPAEIEALDNLHQQFGWGRNDLAADFFPNQPESLPALDFADFVLVVREDMAEDIAHLLAWCVVEKRGLLERQYHHIPPERSPLSYPLEPAKMAKTSLPLHDGAKRYFQEAGLLEE
jgi:TRAP-type uncharacterized transport system substrate-binding protein